MTASQPPAEALLLRELADRLGISERQVRKLTHRGLPRLTPRGGRERAGRYPWPEARDWYLAHRREAIAARSAKSRLARLTLAARRREERAPDLNPT